MSVSAVLGDLRSIDVPAGTIEYRESGDGPAVVFVHGVGVNGDLWRNVAPELARDHRCIVPDLPFGAHSRPLRDDADLSLPGMARIVADFIAALGLEEVAVVANDTGGAVAQWLVGHHPERIGRLVLTSCDAFEKFPPTPQRYLEVAARSRALMWVVGRTVRFTFVQRLPTAYGWVTQRPIDPAIMHSYTGPIGTRAGVRRDLQRLLRAVDTRYTFEAAESLRSFDKPALVLWADGDKIFPREHGRRLAELLPQGRFDLVTDSRTFIPEDQPGKLTATVREFLAEQQRVVA
jgi:pimeloyl-ACP methyl ester carboxylesterase